MKAQQLAIATSSTGTLGLITSQEKVPHTYTDGSTAIVWTGIILEDNTFMIGDKKIEAKKGGVWSSSQPTVIALTSKERMFNSSNQKEQQAWVKASTENEVRSENI